MKNNILQLVNVKKEFDIGRKKKLKAVNDVSLDIKAGECVAIVGESGCGKSTLAKVITHIEEVSAGKIMFEGKDITKIKRDDLKKYRRNVQMIFQHPSAVFSPRMKIGAFLMELWINFEKKSKQEAKDMAYYALERVKLSKEYFNKYPHELSGGELQRVSIARAISLHPQMLICDEVTSALDVSIQKDIIDLLREHRCEDSFAIIFICHDLALVENFCDRVVVMYLGRVVEIMSSKHLKRQAVHPYTKALLDSVFRVHDTQDKDINVLEGEAPSPISLPDGCAFSARCEYATEKCRNECPELKKNIDGHYVACHMVGEDGVFGEDGQ